MVLLETDEAGVLRARTLVKELLEPLYGVTKTITVEEWFWQAHELKPTPFKVNGRPVVEHSESSRNGRVRHS